MRKLFLCVLCAQIASFAFAGNEKHNRVITIKNIHPEQTAARIIFANRYQDLAWRTNTPNQSAS